LDPCSTAVEYPWHNILHILLNSGRSSAYTDYIFGSLSKYAMNILVIMMLHNLYLKKSAYITFFLSLRQNTLQKRSMLKQAVLEEQWLRLRPEDCRSTPHRPIPLLVSQDVGTRKLTRVHTKYGKNIWQYPTSKRWHQVPHKQVRVACQLFTKVSGSVDFAFVYDCFILACAL
jgi:hypothetical protein